MPAAGRPSRPVVSISARPSPSRQSARAAVLVAAGDGQREVDLELTTSLLASLRELAKDPMDDALRLRAERGLQDACGAVDEALDELACRGARVCLDASGAANLRDVPWTLALRSVLSGRFSLVQGTALDPLRRGARPLAAIVRILVLVGSQRQEDGVNAAEPAVEEALGRLVELGIDLPLQVAIAAPACFGRCAQNAEFFTLGKRADLDRALTEGADVVVYLGHSNAAAGAPATGLVFDFGGVEEAVTFEELAGMLPPLALLILQACAVRPAPSALLDRCDSVVCIPAVVPPLFCAELTALLLEAVVRRRYAPPEAVVDARQALRRIDPDDVRLGWLHAYDWCFELWSNVPELSPIVDQDEVAVMRYRRALARRRKASCSLVLCDRYKPREVVATSPALREYSRVVVPKATSERMAQLARELARVDPDSSRGAPLFLDIEACERQQPKSSLEDVLEHAVRSARLDGQWRRAAVRALRTLGQAGRLRVVMNVGHGPDCWDLAADVLEQWPACSFLLGCRRPAPLCDEFVVARFPSRWHRLQQGVAALMAGLTADL